jgi:cysteine desulfurase
MATPASPLYLDYAASTPPAAVVVEAMLPWLQQSHANPHSEHWHGHRAARAVEDARDAVAQLIGANDSDVVFTSGATEANNLALKGLLSPGGHRRRLWLSPVEHKSLREPARSLASAGIRVEWLDIDCYGQIDIERLSVLMAGAEVMPGLVAVTYGNNEIGTLQDMAAISGIAHASDHAVHVDASQSAGSETLDVRRMGCDLLCLSSHKIYGPGGIGALYVAPSLRGELQPQLHGGGQEGGLRSGTVPVFLAVGFGMAARLALQSKDQHRRHLHALAEAFQARLCESGIDFEIVGAPEARLAGHCSVRFLGIDADDLLGVLAPTLSVSSGAACAAGELRASPVLRALGLDERAAGEVVRLTFGRDMPIERGTWVADQVAYAVRRILARST